MLKRLELVGFKSFADETTFDFAPGITAIVGPNGSGKSNIVDAVKWILGEQSAKSLRGGEMADVIFNGSSSRRSLGLAEVTMTFDNTKRYLTIDADEVQFTRRVYRDGQGEYLINHQPSRLRDIKDLFLGSGAGHGAYSIIEQGRVDALLQASHKDRRQIFEEAAGISRFKARKIETLRKLEHVEQNLQRSNDILAELDKQLRSVKLQAAKAQRYQEHSTRLKELRVALGLREYDDLTRQLRAETDALGQLQTDLERAAERMVAGEKELRQLDDALAGLDRCLHEHEARLAEARQQIATQEAKRDFETTAVTELESDLAGARERRAELTERLADTAEQVALARAEYRTGADQVEQGRTHVATWEGRLHAVEVELERLRRQVEADRAEHLERLRGTTRLQNDAISLKTRLENLRSRRDGLSVRSAETSERIASLHVELDALVQEETRLAIELSDAREEHGRQIEERDDVRRQAAEAAQRLADLRVQRSGLASRIELLEQLEKRQEGLGTGVREILELMRESRVGDADLRREGEDWSFVLGLVADCLTVPREVAPLIDLALGDLAQCFIVSDREKLDAALSKRDQPFSGRVGFVPVRNAERGMRNVDANTAPDALAERADALVTCEHVELHHLPLQLLGTTRIVPDLAAARAAAAQPQNAGLRFVTRNGEMLEADGRLSAGAHHAETGILSRKSELRELRQQALALDYRLADNEVEQVDLRDRLEALELPIFDLQQKINELVEDVGELGARVKLHQQKHSGLADEVELSRGEIDDLVQEIAELEAALTEATRKTDEGEHLARALQQRAEQADRDVRELEQERVQREQESSQARVDLAQREERSAGQGERLQRLEAAWQERQGELAQFERAEAATKTRIRDSLLGILEASAAIADGCRQKDAAERYLTVQAEDRERVRSERKDLAARLQTGTGERQAQWNQAHAHELRASQLRSRRDAIADRLREDYQLNLAEIYERRTKAAVSSADGESRDGVDGSEFRVPSIEFPDPIVAQQEIDELRRKLSRLGAVNLDALQELADLEQRVAAKQAHHADLANSQRDLLEIIAKINQDSKILFTETFAAIRGHFQDLFRKLFGGGMADIILEDENDVLECGIEITARPPGKELRSISLMSGGERTLTAIALLLAIFRSKPSPFCLLDEVDAALDEANNTRLANVLREFVEQSQFIVVTHKKRTMAVADILYGISMQEAGVSKQISVRFEDWPDEEAAEEQRAAG